MIKNILKSIDYEIQDCFSDNNNWNDFIEELKDILEYYSISIYNAGRKLTCNKLHLKFNENISMNDTETIENYTFINYDILKNALITLNSKISKKELFEQVIEMIMDSIIKLYQIAQINECKNNNITNFRLIIDSSYSCNKCKFLSKFIQNVQEFDYSNLHSFCKLLIIPFSDNYINLKFKSCSINNIMVGYEKYISNIIKKIELHLNEFITYKNFYFYNEDTIKIKNNDIYIPYSYLNVESIIVRELLRDKLVLKMDNWWKQYYKMKTKNKSIGDNCIFYNNIFINSMAQLSVTELFIECFINYILNPNELYNIDEEAYNHIKDIIKREFIKW